MMPGADGEAGDLASSPDEFIALAKALADAARPIALKHFRSPLAIDSKADDSPVTIADRDTEAAMRTLIEATFPDHGILGEEHGSERTDAEYVWVLDPIDGTQSFATGKPLFGTLIALARHGRPILGVIDMPALGERFIGIAGQHTVFDGAAISTRRCANLADAWLYATSPQMFPTGDFEAFEGLRKSCRRAIYGGECYAYGLLAAGHVDLVVESTMQPYDYAALVPIVEGAGGVISDWNGRPLTLASDGRVLAAGDAALHTLAGRALVGDAQFTAR
jgi:inositol-phosphate phosphatase/L-galactose 1-phosphate phosphatase/histidinol-phosphatase